MKAFEAAFSRGLQGSLSRGYPWVRVRDVIGVGAVSHRVGNDPLAHAVIVCA